MDHITPLRYDIPTAAKVLGCSRAHLYTRISSGAIAAQKDGARRYISAAELQRYVVACDVASERTGSPA
ncbi:MAG TPA: helix-turn-helix domain-containing protein [Steroidobacteraceae bacterium]|jgi:excisionase family DNA binding protein